MEQPQETMTLTVRSMIERRSTTHLTPYGNTFEMTQSVSIPHLTFVECAEVQRRFHELTEQIKKEFSL